MNPWFVAWGAGLALLMVVLVGFPGWRRARPSAGRADELAVYRDQLAEIDRDLERNIINTSEGAAARLEIERRILRAGEQGGNQNATAGLGSRLVVGAVALLVPLLSAALYGRLGTPTLPDQPILARQDERDGQPDVAAMISRLEARLAQSPDDAEGWLMLGRSRSALGEAAASAIAYRKALELQPDAAEALGGLAESLIVMQNGSVGAEARTLLERLGGQGTADPRPGYYLGVAAAQAGDNAQAEQRWRRLLSESPADAPWRPRVVDAIRAAASQFGIDGSKLVTESTGSPPDPATTEAARIAALPPAERQARIKSMVDGLQTRLERDGGDAAGWARLAQARATLGQEDIALAAWNKALELSPDDPDLLKGKGRSLLGAAPASSDLPIVPDAANELFKRVAELRPDDPETNWYLGIRALQDKQLQQAREHWQRALDRLDPTSPEYAAMQSRMATLPPS